MEAEKDVEAAWYYGSVARGEDGPASDLDVTVVVRTEDVESVLVRLRNALAPVEEELLVAFSIIGLAHKDVRRLSRNDTWWRDLVRDAKVLIGPRPEALAARPKRRDKAA